jgi:Glycosyl transferase family 2
VELRRISARLDELQRAVEQHEARSGEDSRTMREALEHIYDDDRDARVRLRELRATAGYEEAFADSQPLVSVVIATWRNVDTLIHRAIPSALAQTHQAIEVIVVGDASPPETVEAIAELGDSRVRFHNLTIRGPYLEDDRRAWLASGTPGLNHAVASARGLWIAPLGDDDAFGPNHVDRLLTRAREDRLEFVYGKIRQVRPDGHENLLGSFPPRLGAINLQAGIYHGGLRFMELEFGHALFGTPNDWGLIRRMMRAGVRFGMVDEVAVNYWPSPRGFITMPDSAPEQRALAAERARGELEMKVADLMARLEIESARSDALESRARELVSRLSVMQQSRSWRLTAPLRRLRSRG